MEMQHTLTRTESFDCDGPAELDLRIGAGRIEVRTADVSHVRVELAAEPVDGGRWEQGLEDLLERVSRGSTSRPKPTPTPCARRRSRSRRSGAGSSSGLPALPPDRARGRRRGPGALAAHGRDRARLDHHVRCPRRPQGRDPAGDIVADRMDGDVRRTSGLGRVRLGRVAGRLRAARGSGEIEVASIEGESATVTIGSGDVWLGAVRSDVHARTGEGQRGRRRGGRRRLDLVTGAGDLRVAVRPGWRPRSTWSRGRDRPGASSTWPTCLRRTPRPSGCARAPARATRSSRARPTPNRPTAGARPEACRRRSPSLATASNRRRRAFTTRASRFRAVISRHRSHLAPLRWPRSRAAVHRAPLCGAGATDAFAPGARRPAGETAPSAPYARLDVHDLELQRAARGRDLDDLALLAAENRLADRRLVREPVLGRVRLRRADDRVLDRLVRVHVLQADAGADADHIRRRSRRPRSRARSRAGPRASRSGARASPARSSRRRTRSSP